MKLGKGRTVRGAVKHGDVFSGGIPRRLGKLAEALPMIGHLIVPVPGIVEAMKESGEEGSVRAIAYDRAMKITESEVKEIMKEGDTDARIQTRHKDKP